MESVQKRRISGERTELEDTIECTETDEGDEMNRIGELMGRVQNWRISGNWEESEEK